MASPFSLPEELVEQAQRERSDRWLSEVAGDLDRQVQQAFGGLKEIARATVEPLAPIVQALQGGGLRVPTLEDLTPEWMRPSQAPETTGAASEPGARLAQGVWVPNLAELSPGGTPVRSPAEIGRGARMPGSGAGPALAAPAASSAPVAPDEPVTHETVTRSAAAALERAGLPPAMAPYLAGIAINEGILQPGTIARDYWSVGGVKAPGSGGVVTVPTREYVNGQWVTEQASFGRFNSMQEGMDALAAFVRDSPRFGPIVQEAARSGDYAGMIERFRQAGYATDPDWTRKVTSIASGLPVPATPRPGAAPAEEQPAAQAQTAVAVAGQFTRNQGEVGRALGLPWERALEICGPVAAAAFLRATGRLPGQEEAEAMRVAQEKGYWQPGRGMGGPGTQSQLLTDLGVANRLEHGVDWRKVAADVQRGNPVIVDTPGHYYVVEGYNPQTGQFDLGESARFLRASGGRRWFRPEEIPALGMGAPRSAIYLDNPETPRPSVVAGRVEPSSPVAAQAAGSPSPILLRQGLGTPVPMPGSVDQQATGGVPGLGEGDRPGYGAGYQFPYGGVRQPLDVRYEGEEPYSVTDREGVDLTDTPLYAPPLPAPAVNPGDHRLASLDPSAEAQADVYGPAPGAVPPGMMSPNPSDLSELGRPSVTITQGGPPTGPSVPLYSAEISGPDLSPQGTPIAAPGMAPSWTYDAPPSQGLPNGGLIPPGSPYGPGQQEAMEPRADRFATGGESVTPNVIGTLGEAASNAAQRAAETAQPSEPAQIVANAAKPPMQLGIEIVQAATDAFGETVGRRVGQALGLTDEQLFSVAGIPVSAQDIAGFAGSVALDPTNWIPAGAVRPAARAVQEAAPAAAARVQRSLGRGVRSVADDLAGNVERAADDGVQLLGSGLVLSPDEAMMRELTRAYIVPPEVVRAGGGGVNVSASPRIRQAIENTDGARLTPDGLEMRIARWQPEASAGRRSLRGGVFYVPSGSYGERIYQGARSTYGGSVGIPEAAEDELTLFQRPLFVASDGVGEGNLQINAFNRIVGKGEYEKLGSAIRRAWRRVTGSPDGVIPDPARWPDIPDRLTDEIAPIVAPHGIPREHVRAIIDARLGYGSQSATEIAIKESALASVARRAGYDGIIGVEYGRQRLPDGRVVSGMLGEVFDIRESHLPTPDGGYTLHPEFQPGAVPQHLGSGSGFVPSLAANPTARNAAQGALVGAFGEDVQAEAEGREPDPLRRLANAGVGAALAVGAGRAMRPGAGRQLGSGFVPGGNRQTPRMENPVPRQERVAELQLPIRLTDEAQVERIRLDKFPAEIRDDLLAAARGSNFGERLRRGVLPDATVQQIAEEYAPTVDAAIRSARRGRAYSAEEVVGLRNLLTGQAEKVRALADDLASAQMTRDERTTALARLGLEQQKLIALGEIAFGGAPAEAGRALRQFRQLAQSLEEDPTGAGLRYLRKQFGSLDKAEEVAAQYQVMVAQGATPVELATFLRSAKGGWLNRLTILRYASMLSSTTTHLINATGNALMQGVDVATTPLAAAIDVGRARVTGAPREVFLSEVPARLHGMAAAARQGLADAAFIMQHGLRPEDVTKLDQLHQGFGTNIPGVAPAGSRMAGTIDLVMEGPLRALSAADAVFRATSNGGHLAAEATADAMRANGGKPVAAEAIARSMLKPEVIERAETLAARAVLQESRAEVQAILGMQRNLPPAGQAVLSVAVPFIRTPYNLIAQGVGMTPAGIVQVVRDIRAGKPARQVEERVARMAIGTAVMAWASWQNIQGNLTGPLPESEAERSTLPPGWRPWSYRAQPPSGETWYIPLATLGPLAVPAVVSILATEHARQGKAFTPERAAQIALGIGQFASDQTFLRGISDLAEALSRGGSKIENYVEQAATQFSPHFLGGGAIGRQLQQIMGMPQRDPDGAIEAILATHPAQDMIASATGREPVPPRRDVLGRPQVTAPGGVVSAVAPFRPSVERDAPVIAAFRRAGEGLPLSPPTKLRDPDTGEVRTLSRHQQQRWQVEFGRALREEWQAAGNPTDREALRSIEGEARQRALAAAFGR